MIRRIVLLFIAVAVFFASATHAALDADAIGKIAAAKATASPDGVVRITFPRSEVNVTVDGTSLKPFAGLTAWAAFTPSDAGAMMMGDTVVFEDEVAPAMDAAFAAGLEVTALHNHFLFDEPKVFFMHIGGEGKPEELAGAVKQVWDAIKAVRAAAPAPAKVFPGGAPEVGVITPDPLEAIIGAKATAQDGMVKFTIGRDGTMHGTKIGASMGLTTWAVFTGSDSSAVVDGDVIMVASEVQTVLRSLRKAGIYVVALHNHMIGESPAFYFVHFWGKGPARELANGLKDVFNAQKSVGTKEMKEH